MRKVHNIWGVGRNYAEHAAELGNSVPEKPLIFLKAGSSLVEGKNVELPQWTQNVHHEIEIAVQLGDQLQIESMALALDLTERTVQDELKKKQHPWTLAKSFRNACAISQLVPVSNIKDLDHLSFDLKVNGEVRQHGTTNQMIFGFESLTHFIQKFFPVVPGDLILTGTPSGVGPLKRGDQLAAQIHGKLKMEWSIL